MNNKITLRKLFQKPRKAYRILRKIDKGYYGSKVARSLGVDPSTVTYYLRIAKRNDFVEEKKSK